MSESPMEIRDVSDTALWVAGYRAEESARPDALFRDELAPRLAGSRGRAMAERSGRAFRYSKWSVIVRTVVIDALLRELAAGGIDTVLNLGAGLDTRAYRLDLPSSLRWIEVDQTHLVEQKERALAGEVPRIPLERIGLDLSDEDGRRELFARIGGSARNVAVLTEGVIPYLTEEQVGSLADALRAEPAFRFWIAEYYAPEVYRHLRAPARARAMRNAPFRFFPADWFAFFARHGWVPHVTRYLPEEGAKAGRPMPIPLWARLLLRLAPPAALERHRRVSAYVVLAPSERAAAEVR
jgi:methyltransferase (TIGR00027 family)